MKRVVITGMGTINPLGNSVPEFWKNIKENKCAISENTRLDHTEYESKIAGLVKDFQANKFMDGKAARKMGLFTQYAVAASIEAMKDAELKEGDYDPFRAGVILGNGIGGFEIIEDSMEKLFNHGPKRVPPMTIPKLISNEAPGNVAIQFKMQGPCYTLTTACASGTDAIGSAFNAIRNGQLELAITGGTEAAITKLGIAGFCRLKALSTGYNENPQKASRPFDKNRDGFVMSEGAGIMVLEELDHAIARGANIYGEVTGYGITCDANHLTAPHPEGLGAVKAMEMALQTANLKPENIDYINAHGTSTPTNDPIETMAIKKAFGEHAYKLKVSSTKGMTGHLVGAAGAVEAIISTMAIKDNFYPATINLEEPAEGCDLDYVANKGINGEINTVMSNSLGFGGHNGVLIIQKYQK